MNILQSPSTGSSIWPMCRVTAVWFLAIACPSTWRWAAVCDAFRFLPVRLYGKYTKHLVSIRISTHSDKMRIGDIPTRSTLSPPRLSDGCAEV